MKKLIIFFAAAIAFSSAYIAPEPASAQLVCGPGTTPSPAGPGGQVPCIPISDYSGSGSSGPTYATRWGAFAISDENKIGLAGGMPSKGKAKKAAIEHCIAKGGTNCKLLVAYYNQCAVVLAGKETDGRVATMYSHAATLEEASESGLKYCAEGGLSECKIYFSDCSYAELVG
ncbi:DUF4189 domain-containing protein [[Pseudomonas] boreopolis]|uniref:DUF4189 domain-containing protein n=1 Tax=Xanthomonas boreopolis TaxID=86183 RepID=UPI003D9B2561